MKCPKCNTENEERAVVCVSCGVILRIVDEADRKSQDLPTGLKGFNWGAFYLPVVWCLANRLWFYFLLFAVFDCVCYWLLAESINSVFGWYSVAVRGCAALYLGIKANHLAWSKWNGGYYKDFELKQKLISGAGWVGAVGVFLILVPYPRPTRNKANFTGCVEQLKNISSGLEQQISVKGSLVGIKSEDDVCHHVLSGYETPKGCIGKVKARVDEICL